MILVKSSFLFTTSSICAISSSIDHKFIIDINDPLFSTLLPHFSDKKDFYSMSEGYMIPNLNKIKDQPKHIYEMYEGYVVVDFVPTSENLSAWLLKIVAKKMEPLNIKVSHIEYFETPKSKSTVYAT